MSAQWPCKWRGYKTCVEKDVSKRVDFAKQRRVKGRTLSRSVRDLAALLQQVADLNGIDLQARLKETSTHKSERRQLLAERLQQSVLPLFIMRRGRPDRIGSCVLVSLDSDSFAFTAAHVIRDSKGARLYAPSESKGGKLVPLPRYTAYLSPSPAGRGNDLDVALLSFTERDIFPGHVFLSGAEIDKDERLDDLSVKSFYFVFGYSASRTQVKVSGHQIYQQSFQCATGPVDAPEYVHEEISQVDYILLDFDHKEIRVQGKRADPPKLQGVSGGGIFHISRETNQGPLVAIATQNRRHSRWIMGTRLKHFLALAREIRRQRKGGATRD